MFNGCSPAFGLVGSYDECCRNAVFRQLKRIRKKVSMAIRKTAEGHVISGFKMKLYPGFAEEYEKRHNELWPEMADMIHEYGGHNYSIFIDEETNILFGYIELDDPERYNESANTEICKKWWDFMASVMETNEDNSPVSVDLPCAFHLD